MDDLSTLLSKAAVDSSCDGYRLSGEAFCSNFVRASLSIAKKVWFRVTIFRLVLEGIGTRSSS